MHSNHSHKGHPVRRENVITGASLYSHYPPSHPIRGNGPYITRHLRHYGGGHAHGGSKRVYNGPCGKDLDHGVAVVGVGTTLDGTEYWIVKNSWGTEWGEHGYIRMEKGTHSEGGMCGIAMEASYPVKKTSDNPKLTPPKDEL